ncbi:uncharacterized protein SRS1_25035 [Sporisorium reilianum f. sp. reilianum]|uniref:Uncharacterized protein n=1 Tax=Sporisorium reilianum f. sp. reilianum TaxID=72559 RepID=A0A2N8UHS7_9BASI|nr:uncharacterized protein SRS1_25035 [Sporisorium reilianum f. sp. reilianum]
MRAWLLGTITLSFLLMAATAFALPSRDPDPVRIDKRMMGEGDSSRGSDRITFQQLKEDGFTPEEGLLSTHDANKYSMYEDKLFFGGKPLFVFNDHQSKKLVNRLQQAFTDFGGFHARLGSSGDIVSFPHTDTNVMGQVLYSDGTAQKFGPNVVVVAHGYKAVPLPTRKGKHFWGKSKSQAPPKWEEIHASRPQNPSTSVRNLRQVLNSQRYLVFKSSDGGLSLAIRAHPDGRIEHNLTELSRIMPFVRA